MVRTSGSEEGEGVDLIGAERASRRGMTTRKDSKPFRNTGRRVRLTQRAVEVECERHARLRAKQGGKAKATRLWDTGCRALFLYVTRAGRAGFYVRFVKPGGGASDCLVGRTDEITVPMARERAEAMLRGLKLDGVDPVEAKREREREAAMRRVNTLEALASMYREAPERQARRKRTLEDFDARMSKYVLPILGKRPFAEISPKEVVQLLNAVWRMAGGKPGSKRGNRTANLVHADLRALFAWAMREELAEANPAAFGKKFDDRPQKRVGVLSDEILCAIWEGLELEKRKGWGVAAAIGVQLCMTTLQRPNEIARARREDFDWKAGVWRVHPDRNKTGVYYEVPLSELAADLFKQAFKLSRGRWAFPTAAEREGPIDLSTLSHRFAKLRRRLVGAGKLASADIELYDMRRFGRTVLEQRLGVSEYIAERCINHAAGDGAMRRRYFVGDTSGQVRRAMEAWSAELLRIVEGREPDANVVTLQRP